MTATLEMASPRIAFGETLVELAERYPEMLVLDGDLANSTRADIFNAAYPDRFLEMGIAEQNMIGVAAGLATVGFTPLDLHLRRLSRLAFPRSDSGGRRPAASERQDGRRLLRSADRRDRQDPPGGRGHRHLPRHAGHDCGGARRRGRGPSCHGRFDGARRPCLSAPHPRSHRPVITPRDRPVRDRASVRAARGRRRRDHLDRRRRPRACSRRPNALAAEGVPRTCCTFRRSSRSIPRPS